MGINQSSEASVGIESEEDSLNPSIEASIDIKSEDLSLKSSSEETVDNKSEDLSLKRSSETSVDIKSEDLSLRQSSKRSIDIKSEDLKLSSVHGDVHGDGVTGVVADEMRPADSLETGKKRQAGLQANHGNERATQMSFYSASSEEGSTSVSDEEFDREVRINAWREDVHRHLARPRKRNEEFDVIEIIGETIYEVETPRQVKGRDAQSHRKRKRSTQNVSADNVQTTANDATNDKIEMAVDFGPRKHTKTSVPASYRVSGLKMHKNGPEIPLPKFRFRLEAEESKRMAR